jgi:hypothetical protein
VVRAWFVVYVCVVRTRNLNAPSPKELRTTRDAHSQRRLAARRASALVPDAGCDADGSAEWRVRFLRTTHNRYRWTSCASCCSTAPGRALRTATLRRSCTLRGCRRRRAARRWRAGSGRASGGSPARRRACGCRPALVRSRAMRPRPPRRTGDGATCAARARARRRGAPRREGWACLVSPLPPRLWACKSGAQGACCCTPHAGGVCLASAHPGARSLVRHARQAACVRTGLHGG